ncbi:MAG: TolC family protein, partial [Planctomycetota bacterium]|nr:TolC family protein [Planctomycetota bacterium]
MLAILGGTGLSGCSSTSRIARTPLKSPIETSSSAAQIAIPQSATRKIDAVDAAESCVKTASVADDDTSPQLQLVSKQIETNVISHSEIETPMDLGAILLLVGGDHPAVGFARWRVQEAYAEQTRAETLWLPSIQAGVSFHQHGGNLQASNGTIQDVNRSSLQAGLGTGAVGAGTTPNPGIVARFHMADAIFAPAIAEKTTWAQSHAATAAVNDQLLAASLAWLQLLTAEQRIAILSDSMERTEQLDKITTDFAESGQGLLSDADRMTTEKSLAKTRLISAQEQAEVSSVRLIEAISARSGQRIVPIEQAVVPIQLVSVSADSSQLIHQGLHYRPELKEAQCLVGAACERYQRQKYGPFVPSVLLGMSQTGFGGGQGTTSNNFNNRVDFDAAVTWELRGLGYGEQAARRSTAAQVEQARFRQVRLMDQVAREISEAHTQVKFRQERITVAEQGIEAAEDSVRRNLDRIRNGQGLPIEALQAIRA